MSVGFKDVELKYATKAKMDNKTGMWKSRNKKDLVNLCYKVDGNPYYFSLELEQANYFNKFIRALYEGPKESTDKRKTILCAITANHSIPSTFMKEFLSFYDYNRKFFNMKVNFIVNYIVDEGRSQQIEYAKSLAKKPDYIFFIDADNTFKKDTLIKLVDAKKPIVSGLYFQRSKPYYPVAFKNNKRGVAEFVTDYKQNKLQVVDYVGAGCLLIKYKVLHKMKYPQWYIHRNKSRTTIGEDIVFCAKLKNKGYKIWLHAGVIAGHIGGVCINEQDYMHFKNANEYIPHLKTNIVGIQSKVKRRNDF
jgi:cellulose synthase/poly-beta-1,6-N-acetylglucosamine synthase-like glycosyltransferase